VSAIIHRFPARPHADTGSGAAFFAGFHQARRGRCAEDYRRVLTRLMAAGVTGSEAIAEALNAEPIYTPHGTAWDAAAVERLLGFLRHRGRAPLVAPAPTPRMP
jgi:hypothetical protein